MSTLEALVPGVVQGLTEFLPISSTAHLAFLLRFLATHSTRVFVTYRIALGALVFALVAGGAIR